MNAWPRVIFKSLERFDRIVMECALVRRGKFGGNAQQRLGLKSNGESMATSTGVVPHAIEAHRALK